MGTKPQILKHFLVLAPAPGITPSLRVVNTRNNEIIRQSAHVQLQINKDERSLSLSHSWSAPFLTGPTVPRRTTCRASARRRVRGVTSPPLCLSHNPTLWGASAPHTDWAPRVIYKGIVASFSAGTYANTLRRTRSDSGWLSVTSDNTRRSFPGKKRVLFRFCVKHQENSWLFCTYRHLRRALGGFQQHLIIKFSQSELIKPLAGGML